MMCYTRHPSSYKASSSNAYSLLPYLEIHTLANTHCNLTPAQ